MKLQALIETDFEKANQTVHNVEDQWHYPIFKKYGFEPQTKSAIGFVRKYTYAHPSGYVMQANTGASSDYWIDPSTKKQGYWRELEPHLKELNLN